EPSAWGPFILLFQRGEKQSPIFELGETVGHTGEVVANDAFEAGERLAGGGAPVRGGRASNGGRTRPSPEMLLRHELWRFRVLRKERLQDALAVGRHAQDAMMGVNARAQEPLQTGLQSPHFRRKSDQHRTGRADIFQVSYSLGIHPADRLFE